MTLRHVADESESPRADDHPGRDVSQDRAQPEEAKQRNRDDGGAEEDGNLSECDSRRVPSQQSLAIWVGPLESVAADPHAFRLCCTRMTPLTGDS